MPNRFEALPVDLITNIFSHVSLEDAERLHEDENFKRLSPNLVANKCAQAYQAVKLISGLEPVTTGGVYLVFKTPFTVLLDLGQRPEAYKHVLTLDVTYQNNPFWWRTRPVNSWDRTEDDQVVRCWAYRQMFPPKWLETHSWVARINAGLRWEYSSAASELHATNAPRFHEDPFNFNYSSHLADLFHLLASLPNLEDLAIPVPGVNLNALGTIWHELEAHSFARLPGYLSQPLLGQLKVLKLFPIASDVKRCELPCFDALWYLKELPNLSNVVVNGRGHYFTTLSSSPSTKAAARHVQRLDIIDLNLSLVAFRNLLLFFPRLQVLVIERNDDHRSKPAIRMEGNDDFSPPDPGQLMRLRDSPRNMDDFVARVYMQTFWNEGYLPKWHSAWTLLGRLVSPEVLSPCSTITALRVSQGYLGLGSWMDDWAVLESTPRHFLGFPELRTLDVTARFFCTHQVKESIFDPLILYVETPLSECLPAQLELLKVQSIPNLFIAKGLFASMPSMKDAKLPNLRRMVISSPSQDAIDYVSALATNMGIRLEVLDVDEEWVPFATSLP